MQRMFALCCVLFICAGAFAQFDSASVVGTVHDSSGAVVPGATVAIMSSQTGSVSTVTTNAQGDFEFPTLRIGTYDVRAEKQGFTSTSAKGVVLNVSARQRVDMTLSVGNNTETVTVTDTTPLLQTETSERGQIVEKPQIVGLPLNSREYSQLILLSTGTRQSAIGTGSISTNREGAFNVNGLRSTFNNFLLDGLDNNAYGTSNQGFSNQVTQPSPDAVAEFQIVTNNESAQYGRAAGATVNVAFASGSNQFHGTAYEFLRNKVLNGVGFFKPAGGMKPQYNRNQFGGTFGGPILKNRAFFFTDYEGLRQVRGILTFTTLPTPNMRAGILPLAVRNPYTGTVYASGTPIPMTLFAGKVLSALPNTAELTGTGLPSNNYQTLQRFTNYGDKYDAKLDYRVSERVNGFTRWSQRKANLIDNPPIPLPSGGSGNGHTTVLNQQFATGLTWLQENNHLLEFRFGVSRTKGGKWPLALGTPDANTMYGLTGLPTDPRITGGLPTELITGFSDLGRQATNPQWQFPLVFNPKVNYSMPTGRHSLKFGYEYQHVRVTVQDVNPLYGRDTYSGQFSRPTGVPSSNFYNFADFLFGARSQYAISTFLIAHLRQNMHFGYVQDDWRVSDRLTLNLGMRYEYASPYSEVQNHMTNFDPTSLKMVTASDSDPFLIDPDRNNFGPRFGLAYQLMKNTVLRGGYGVSFVHYNRAGAGNLLAINGPQVINAVVNQTNPTATTFVPTNQGYPVGITDPSNFNPLTANITYVPRDYRTSYVQSWFLSLQRQLAKDILLDVAYVGNHGLKLLMFGNYNQARPYTTAGALAANRPIPTWGDITYAFNGGASNYHSLQVRYEQRAKGGLTFLNSFTWSRAVDNVAGSLENPNGNYPAPQNIYNLAAERGESAYDTPISNITSVVYDLPFGSNRRWGRSLPIALEHVVGGWQISAINQTLSGQPLTVTYSPSTQFVVSGIQQDFRGANNYRPNLVSGVPVILPGGGPKNGLPYLNVAAFSTPCVAISASCASPSPFGNAPRNLVRGPRFNQLDLAANKTFRITERSSLQFRAEFFNLLNHTNFLPPSTNFSSSSFGKITNAYDPRQVQFALKFSY